MRFLSCERISEHKYKTPEGYLVCVDSILARTGKQSYHRDEIFHDSSDEMVEVDRTADEVFSKETLASFENKPLTVEHPDEDVNVNNHNEYAVGFVRDIKRGVVDGQEVMLGTLVVTDGKTIEEIENGEHTDLSCGYDCDIEDVENPQQKHIRGNHIALCKEGRAGIARIVDSVRDIKPIHENIREQIKYVMQSDADKNLYFYIGEKYAMKEGDDSYQQYDLAGQSPESLKAELANNGWHQVSRGPASFIDSKAISNVDTCMNDDIVCKDDKEYKIYATTSFGKQLIVKWSAESADAAVREFLELNPAYRNDKKGIISAEDSCRLYDGDPYDVLNDDEKFLQKLKTRLSIKPCDIKHLRATFANNQYFNQLSNDEIQKLVFDNFKIVLKDCEDIEMKDSRIGDARVGMSGEHRDDPNSKDYYGYMHVEHPKYGSFYLSALILPKSRAGIRTDGYPWNFLQSGEYRLTSEQKRWAEQHKSELGRIAKAHSWGNVADTKADKLRKVIHIYHLISK